MTPATEVAARVLDAVQTGAARTFADLGSAERHLLAAVCLSAGQSGFRARGAARAIRELVQQGLIEVLEHSGPVRICRPTFAGWLVFGAGTLGGDR